MSAANGLLPAAYTPRTPAERIPVASQPWSDMTDSEKKVERTRLRAVMTLQEKHDDDLDLVAKRKAAEKAAQLAAKGAAKQTAKDAKVTAATAAAAAPAAAGAASKGKDSKKNGTKAAPGTTPAPAAASKPKN